MWNMCAKSRLSSFKIIGGGRGDWQTTTPYPYTCKWKNYSLMKNLTLHLLNYMADNNNNLEQHDSGGTDADSTPLHTYKSPVI